MIPLGRSAIPLNLVAALVAGGCSAPDSIDVDPALEEVPVEQCREDPAELPAGQEFYDNLLDLSGPTTLVLEQDPEGVGDASAARLSFEGDTFLSRWSGDDAIIGTVLGNTFLGPDTGVTEAGAADCARIYYLQGPRLTVYGDRLLGRISVIHLR